MFENKTLYHIISIFEERNGEYGIYGQGIDSYTGQMKLDWITSGYQKLETARERATLLAAEHDCYVIETLKGCRQKAIDVNENIEIGGWTN